MSLLLQNQASSASRRCREHGLRYKLFARYWHLYPLFILVLLLSMKHLLAFLKPDRRHARRCCVCAHQTRLFRLIKTFKHEHERERETLFPHTSTFTRTREHIRVTGSTFVLFVGAYYWYLVAGWSVSLISGYTRRGHGKA